MSRSDDQRVADIVEAASNLTTLVERGRETFDQDLVIRLAMERLLEIIGEASHRLSEDFKNEHGAVDWRAISDLRIILAHLYHRVDPDLIWNMATDSVPELIERIDR
ncbi:MAG: HepT-like ribonuclease domain-containing protein [Actinomycetes bacterium]|jgi:hypothetical protein